MKTPFKSADCLFPSFSMPHKLLTVAHPTFASHTLFISGPAPPHFLSSCSAESEGQAKADATNVSGSCFYSWNVREPRKSSLYFPVSQDELAVTDGMLKIYMIIQEFRISRRRSIIRMMSAPVAKAKAKNERESTTCDMECLILCGCRAGRVALNP